jgi:DNA-binding Lrp family transcriptional regulator
VDHLDFAVYRFLSPRGEARFWAGRRIIDPTVPAREIAERVGVSENGVRTRLRGLEERGFLRGKTLTPNPSLFGVRVFVAPLPIATPADSGRVFHDLALVEGVVFARDTIDEGEREVLVYFVAPDDATAVRRTALLRRLSPGSEVPPAEPYWIPPCERAVSPLDWRLLEAMRRLPDATMAEVARAVGISLKTAARRSRQLLDARACWWTHGPDAEEFPLALIRLDLHHAAEWGAVTEGVSRETADWIPVANDGLGLDPPAAATVVAGLVPAESPAVVERSVKKLVALPGVRAVRRTFALGSMSYPTWYREQIAGHVPVRR